MRIFSPDVVQAADTPRSGSAKNTSQPPMLNTVMAMAMVQSSWDCDSAVVNAMENANRQSSASAQPKL